MCWRRCHVSWRSGHGASGGGGSNHRFKDNHFVIFSSQVINLAIHISYQLFLIFKVPEKQILPFTVHKNIAKIKVTFMVLANLKNTIHSSHNIVTHVLICNLYCDLWLNYSSWSVKFILFYITGLPKVLLLWFSFSFLCSLWFMKKQQNLSELVRTCQNLSYILWVPYTYFKSFKNAWMAIKCNV